MGGGRLGVVIAVLGSGAISAAEVVTRTETTVLNVPLSMLYVAIAGTMFGFFLLPARDAARVNAAPGADWRHRLGYSLFSIALVAVAAICYAFVTAWAVQAGVGIIATIFTRSVHESVILPVTGLVGVGIRPWLPSLLKAVERRADRVIGGSP
jgi:hypothetical protein